MSFILKSNNNNNNKNNTNKNKDNQNMLNFISHHSKQSYNDIYSIPTSNDDKTKCDGIYIEDNSNKDLINNEAKIDDDGLEINFEDIENNIGEQLGNGKFGNVYSGFYNGMKVAFKFLSSGVPSVYYNNEIDIYKILNKSNHPSFIKLIGYSESVNYNKCIVLEFVKGCEINKFINKQDKEYLKENPLVILNIIIEIANAIQFLHGQSPPIIHGDLSGSNILIIQQNNEIKIKLIDFGISHIKGNVDHLDIKGQNRYISPEVLKSGRSSFSEKSDVYSFSILIFEILCNVYNSNVFDGSSSNYREWVNEFYSNYKFENIIHQKVVELISQCGDCNPCSRPLFNNIISKLNQIKNDY